MKLVEKTLTDVVLLAGVSVIMSALMRVPGPSRRDLVVMAVGLTVVNLSRVAARRLLTLWRRRRADGTATAAVAS